MDKLQFIDTLAEIDMHCDKIKAIINNLRDRYGDTCGAEPQVTALKAEAINADVGTSEYNAANFICGYNEIMQFIQIAFDYVCDISNIAKEAIK
ncbi:MAG: hypothetical protein Q4E74_11925 [Ruminococcus sp.]|nr:hypothetical protein [Ruminococcus sp.]